MRPVLAPWFLLMLWHHTLAFNQPKYAPRRGTFKLNREKTPVPNSVEPKNLMSSNNPFLSAFCAGIFLTTTLSPYHLIPVTHFTAPIEILGAQALTEQQQLVNDVWKEVTRQYFDTTYNGLGEEGWKQKRLDAVKSTMNFTPDDKEALYDTIRRMLTSLGDPYTRFLTPEQFESLKVSAKGGSAGVGVTLIVDLRTGNVKVASTTPDGPAEKSGLQSGDSIVEVDGMDVRMATAELVAAKLRGEPKTSVNLAIQRDNNLSYYTIQRAAIKIGKVQTSTVAIDKKKIGILKLSSFNQETASQVVDGLRTLKGVQALVVDVRGNAGGYMPAGVDVAKLFLPQQTRIISEVDKSGRSTVYVSDGIGSDTQTPLFILVDERTASASEIFVAALQDNGRAKIVGAKTFGKGRIQNVQELFDGSGVSVTKAKYMTPSGSDIHGAGIVPDIVRSCNADDAASMCLTEGIIKNL